MARIGILALLIAAVLAACASPSGGAIVSPSAGVNASGEGDSTIYGGTYGSGLLVLPAGDYSINVWLATYDGGVIGSPRDECSTRVTLRPLDDVALSAEFPPDQACSLGPAPVPSPEPGS